jgi:hypothetical protein
MVQRSVSEMLSHSLTVYVSRTRSGGVKLDFVSGRKPAKMSRAHIKRAGGLRQALASWEAQESRGTAIINTVML